jgi:hypothetical protein
MFEVLIKKTIPLLFLFSARLYSQNGNEIKVFSRYNYYTNEKQGEIIIKTPPSLYPETLKIIIRSGDSVLCETEKKPGSGTLKTVVEISDPESSGTLEAEIICLRKGFKQKISFPFLILKHKPNEVKIDRLTGGLIVNNLPFFPFGFYCYSPVYRTLPEEEAVRGFNVISPYQKITPESLNERKAYMDRCAQLGMKVHYNLLSVAGGGGVSSKIEGLSSQEKEERLIKEIRTFMDHPALLAWYIADEPNGYRLLPDSLENIYNIVHETDPWHPVSVVFMSPFMSAVKYSDALDIVMADPYPVPGLPVSYVGNATAQLTKAFNESKPVWIVPQAFGGGEIWEREPTLQELRSMTYQAIINGAKGIQYFVRQGLNYFPKSTGTWGECGRMAVETAEITPWLLSDEASPGVSVSNPDISAKSFLHNGKLLILAVNKTNSPQSAFFSVPVISKDKLRVLFENRLINLSEGAFSDILSAYGSQAYLIDTGNGKDQIKLWSGNLLKDPGFEDLSSPGIPAACYARGNGERGATYFTDPREFTEGHHSLRLVTPRENSSVKLRFFPFKVRPGATYIISVMARTDAEQGFENKNGRHYFEIGLGEFGKERFLMTNEWKQFVTFVTIPDMEDIPDRVNLILQMPAAGVGWFDMIQVAECVDFNITINSSESLIDLSL